MQRKTAMGAFMRRLKARLGAPTAINAGAHKLARLFYRMLKFGATYVEQGQAYYEQKYKDRLLRNLSKRAKEFGFQLTPLEPATDLVSSEDEEHENALTIYNYSLNNRRCFASRRPRTKHG